jgi:hypothetical protein
VAGTKLELTTLSSQHPGVPASVEGFYAVAAAVALNRHHASPVTFEVWLGSDMQSYDGEWRAPTADELRSCADDTDTTCNGAYAVALAAAFAHLGLKAVGRAGNRTGSDWLVLPVDEQVDEWPLENPKIERLEVSGQNEADVGRRNTRLRLKVLQAQAGTLRHIPAYAVVVEFSSPVVAFARAS